MDGRRERSRLRDYRPSRLDGVIAQPRLQKAVADAVGAFEGDVLDIGCGDKPYRDLAVAAPAVRSYLGVDVPNPLYGTPDVEWDGVRLPFGDAAFDRVLLTEVLEHCPDPGAVLSEARRVLRPDGKLFLTVPFLWPLHDVPHDEYRYTPFSLERHVRDAGFASVDVVALGGWDAALAQLLGLWATRRVQGRKRVLACLAVAPVIALLDRIDAPPTSFRSSSMITGLTATATVTG